MWPPFEPGAHGSADRLTPCSPLALPDNRLLKTLGLPVKKEWADFSRDVRLQERVSTILRRVVHHAYLLYQQVTLHNPLSNCTGETEVDLRR